MKHENLTQTIPEEAYFGKKQVIFNGTQYETKIFEREKLLPGNKIDGPAIIVEYSSTIVVPPESTVEIDAYENLIINVN